MQALSISKQPSILKFEEIKEPDIKLSTNKSIKHNKNFDTIHALFFPPTPKHTTWRYTPNVSKEKDNEWISYDPDELQLLEFEAVFYANVQSNFPWRNNVLFQKRPKVSSFNHCYLPRSSNLRSSKCFMKYTLEMSEISKPTISSEDELDTPKIEEYASDEDSKHLDEAFREVLRMQSNDSQQASEDNKQRDDAYKEHQEEEQKEVEPIEDQEQKLVIHEVTISSEGVTQQQTVTRYFNRSSFLRERGLELATSTLQHRIKSVAPIAARHIRVSSIDELAIIPSPLLFAIL